MRVHQQPTAGGPEDQILDALTALLAAGPAPPGGPPASLYRIIHRYGRTGLVRLGGTTASQPVEGLLADWLTRVRTTPAVVAALRDHPGTDGLALVLTKSRSQLGYGRDAAGREYLVTMGPGPATATTASGAGVFAAYDPSGLASAALAAIVEIVAGR